MAKYDPDEFFNRRKPTNADRIRAMSDEELARWFAEIDDCPDTKHESCCRNQCEMCWFDWLKAEAT